jgi:hypothetical protein
MFHLLFHGVQVQGSQSPQDRILGFPNTWIFGYPANRILLILFDPASTDPQIYGSGMFEFTDILITWILSLLRGIQGYFQFYTILSVNGGFPLFKVRAYNQSVSSSNIIKYPNGESFSAH